MRIASVDLSPAQVPDEVAPDGSGLDEVVAFAETFNGYAWGGGPHVIGPRVDDVRRAWLAGDGLPADVDLLRGCLFHWARARRHVPAGQQPDDDRRWLNALLAGLRAALGD